MISFDLLIILFLSSILIIHYYSKDGPTMAQPDAYLRRFCSVDNYTSNSTFQNNLNLLLSSFSSSNITLIKNGYHNISVGQNSDIVYGSFQCRGDVTSEVCQNCVDIAAQEIIQRSRCGNSKEAIIWYDQCMLRYSNQSFFSIMQEIPAFSISNPSNITTNNTNQFREILAKLMDDLVREAVSSDGSSYHNFATGEANFTIIQKVYGLVQCTSDISESDCNRCLQEAISELPRCCEAKRGGRVLFPSCTCRYETYQFFDSEVTVTSLPPSPLVPPPPRNTLKTTKGKNVPKIVIAIVVPSTITVLSTITIWYLCLRKNKEMKQTDVLILRKDIDEIQNAESFQFSVSTIAAATDYFSNANILGEGGFGSVYKGTLSDGQEIAVKRLSRNSGQGEEEFKNEVLLVAKLQHRNLVRLLGFCLDGEEKILIYEFMPNASLDQFIFDSVKRTYLDWETRYKIMGGIAKGLLYLHEDSRLKIVHRDLKASNILLDADMNPKISDFGMARLFVEDQTQANTNRIVGTYGYMAPEYAIHGQFSMKSDVFSFGVLILEILSGLKNNYFYDSEVREDLLSYAWRLWKRGTALELLDPTLRDNCSEVREDLLSYAWRLWKRGTALELLDPTLRDNCSRSEVMRCIHIGLLCVQEDTADRPTMVSIVSKLNNCSTTLPSPSLPAFFVHSSRKETTIHLGQSDQLRAIVSDQSTSDSTTGTGSVNEASISEVFPR